MNYECFFTNYESYQKIRTRLDDDVINLLESNKNLSDHEYTYLNNIIETTKAQLMIEDEQMIKNELNKKPKG